MAGIDYDKGTLKSVEVLNGEQSRTEWAIYSNYTMTFGNLSVTPGVRYDNTSTSGDFWSPSLGVTYLIDKNTLLRALITRGFSSPPLGYIFASTEFFVPNENLRMEETWSYQTGVETKALKYFLFKGTLFRHDVDNAIEPQEFPNGTFTYVNVDKVRRQGVEVEIKTDEIYNTALMAGATYDDVKDLLTGQSVAGTAKYSFDFGIRYAKGDTTLALRGHYIAWNIGNIFTPQQYKTVLDFNANKTLLKRQDIKVDIFAAIHNIFNVQQYLDITQMNAGRWLEGGMRISFF